MARLSEPSLPVQETAGAEDVGPESARQNPGTVGPVVPAEVHPTSPAKKLRSLRGAPVPLVVLTVLAVGLVIGALYIFLGTLGLGGDARGTESAGAGSSIALEVVGTEFAFVPNQLEMASPGELALALRNQGGIEHDLIFADVEGRLLAKPGETVRGSFTLDKPGTYTFLCTIPGHFQAGMKGTLVVGQGDAAAVSATDAATTEASSGSQTTSFNGKVITPLEDLPEFTLQRADGTRFTTADTRGRASLFFFGYTYCPDVCPLTLSYAGQVPGALGVSMQQQVGVYFVTVDPARDTPERLANYVANFDPSIVALTGTPAELEQVRSIFGITAEKRAAPEESAAGYFMAHTAFIYLVDPESRIHLRYRHTVEPARIVADIKRLLAG